jgi:hypothetical protein
VWGDARRRRFEQCAGLPRDHSGRCARGLAPSSIYQLSPNHEERIVSQILKLSMAAAAVLVLSVSAQAGSDAAGSHSRKMSPEAIGTSHKLQKTYFDTDSTTTRWPPATTTSAPC